MTDSVPFREIATDALRYWEKRRLAYNAGLLVTYVVTHFALSGGKVNSDGVSGGLKLFYWFAGLSVLAALANLCYTIVYPIDLFVQASDYRASWRRRRWMLFLLGMLFAACLAIVWASVFSMARGAAFV